MQQNDTQSGGSSAQIGRDNTINHGIGYREISRLIRGIEIVILAACICGSATIGAVIYGHRYMPHPGDAIPVTSINMKTISCMMRDRVIIRAAKKKITIVLINHP